MTSQQRRPRQGGRRFYARRKVCYFCVEHAKHIDYRDVRRIGRYVSERGRMEPRRKTGICAKHQRLLALAIKRARHLALLPFTATHARAFAVDPIKVTDISQTTEPESEG